MFDFQGATNAGYSQDEIMQFLSQENPNFDIQGAVESGYTPEEISQFLAQPEQGKEEKGLVEKGARVAGQYGMGMVEAATLPYDLSVAPLASKEAQNVSYRQNIMEDIERLSMQKQTGVWDDKDQELLDSLVSQMKDPEKSGQFVQTADIGVRSLAEKATGLDLQPEGFAEKTASMVGFIKDPKKLKNILKIGIKPKELTKAVLPSKGEFLRGVGIEGGLEIAEDGGYGPIGKLAAMIVGDIVGGTAGGAVKVGKELLKDPKKFLARKAAKFSPKEKRGLQKDIIKSFRKEGIQADIGTITDSNLMKLTQARLSQSGLVGKKLDDLKQQIFSDIRESYSKLAKEVGEAQFATAHEAGVVAKEGVKNILKKDLDEVRGIYKSFEDLVGEKSFVNASGIEKVLQKIERNLSPGKLKSQDQKKVLDVTKNLKQDIATKYDLSDVTKRDIPVSRKGEVKALLNNKKAIQDVINYEIQGGVKQLLKEVVSEIDRAIISIGKENPRAAKEYIRANKRFSEHAKTFRNKEISRLLREEDPAKLMNRMNTIEGMKKLDKILGKTKEGKEIFSQLKRKKLEDLFENSFINNSEKQLKLGTFENALSKGKNKEIAREILGKNNFARLQRIQKNAGLLNEAAQKFYNASKSGVVVADVAIGVKYLRDIFHMLSGNPWPFVKTTGGLLAARGLSSLMSDPEFLKLVEDVIITGKKKGEKELFTAIDKLIPYFKKLEEESTSDQNEMSSPSR